MVSEAETPAMFEKTATRQVVIHRAAGLHARPCLAISTAVGGCQSEVEIRAGGQTANARSIIELLSLGAGQGTELVLTATGPDREQILDTLVDLFANDFGLSEE
jgi:phosphotransferase system HPr (HPr) family protein